MLTKTLTREPGHFPATNYATKQEVCEKRKKHGNLRAHARAGNGPGDKKEATDGVPDDSGDGPGGPGTRHPPDTLAATRTATSEKGADARAGHSPATNCATKQEVCEESGNLDAHA